MIFDLQYTKQNLHSSTGLAMISKLLLRANADQVFKRFGLCSKSPYSQFSDRDIILSFLGLACCGTPYFEAVDFYKNDRLFTKALDLNDLVSKACLRQRMDSLAHNNEKLWPALDAINIKLLKKYARPLPIENTDLIPIDFDVTVMDNTGSNKEGVEQSYRPNVHGYAPMMTNIGRQGYLLNHQFRRGSSHSNCKGSLEYIIASMKIARSLCAKQKLLARFDSGNDSDINIVSLSQFKNAYFIVKRHLKGKNVESSKETLIQYVINNYSSKKVLSDNTVRYFAELPYMAGYYNKSDELIQTNCRLILSVVELNNDINTGQPLLIPYRSLHMWRTNLPKTKYSPKQIIDLYKDHGTSEQFHSEFKSDLDVERLPSSKFKTNQLVMAIAQMAFNLLRIIGQQALEFPLFNPKFHYGRIRLKTVINKIMALPSLLFRKHRRWTIALPRSNPVASVFSYLYSVL